MCIRDSLVSICPHKFHGPNGVGLLFIKSPLLPDPIIFGGGQENNRRSGTENFPAIIGLVNAIESFIRPYVFDKVYLKPLVDRLILRIASMPGCKLISPLKQSLVNTVAFTVEGSDGIALIGGLDPVSYTHLDVYKRQERGRRPFCGGRCRGIHWSL